MADAYLNQPSSIFLPPQKVHNYTLRMTDGPRRMARALSDYHETIAQHLLAGAIGITICFFLLGVNVSDVAYVYPNMEYFLIINTSQYFLQKILRFCIEAHGDK